MNFIFTLIHSGCFISIEEHGVLVSEGFYAHIDDFKLSENYTLFNRKKRSPVHIFIDLQDQYYSRETLPPMSAWKLRKILRYKCRTENPRLQSIHVHKESDNTYLFMDLTLSENHVDWIQFLEESHHPLKHPRLLPLEIESLLEDKKILIPPEKQCLIVLYYEELVGLRQIMFIDGKIAASRLTPIIDKDIKRQIALEVNDTLTYLIAERGADPSSFGFIFLGNTSLFSKLPPLAHTTVDWSRFQETPLKKGLPFNVWSMTTLALVEKKPRFSLFLPCLVDYRAQERRRMVFILGGFFCLWALILGGFFINQHQKILAIKIAFAEEKLKEFPSHTISDTLTLSPKEQALAYGYSHLKAATPDPFILLDDAKGWLQDHFDVKHIEWGYHSPKFKRESWVLDPPTHTNETLDLWVDYLGSDTLQQKARDIQIKIPLKNYVIGKNTYIKEIEVIRLKKEGIDL